MQRFCLRSDPQVTVWPQFLERMCILDIGPLSEIAETEADFPPLCLSFLIGKMEITIVPLRLGGGKA